MKAVQIIIRAHICFFFVFVPLHNIDDWAYDQFFKLKKNFQKPGNISLVEVSNPGYGQTQDWKNSYPALIKTILDQDPQLLIVASYLETLEPDFFTASNKVIFSAFVNEEQKLILPHKGAHPGYQFGFQNLFPDADSVVRKNYLVYSSFPSLALKAFQILNPGKRLNRDLLKPYHINYVGAAGAFPTYTQEQLHRNPQLLKNLKNSIVVMGNGKSFNNDLESPLGKMSKLEIQANFLQSLLNQREIKLTAPSIKKILSIITVTASVLILIFLPLGSAWIAIVCLAFLVATILFLIFVGFQVWIGIANPILCIFATHLVFLGYQLSREEKKKWKLEREADYLKELDQFKNNFISLFSHDLKTPIAKIKAISERLNTEGQNLNPEAVEGLRNIERASNELAKSISDILKVTKMESANLVVSKNALDINRLVEDAVLRLKFVADQKNINLVLDLEPLFSIEGDNALMLEVITNLIENAIKYSPPNRNVIIRTSEKNEKVYLEVIDEGEGIAAEEIPKITSKFYRVPHTAEKVKGSGLGLYLSKYFVELHHGKIEIESKVGKGTKVSFWLPLVQN